MRRSRAGASAGDYTGTLHGLRNPDFFWLPDLGSNQGPTD